MRQNIFDAELEEAKHRTAVRGGIYYKTFAANEQLPSNVPPVIISAGAGAVTIRLPPSNAANAGRELKVMTDQAAVTVVTLNTDGGAAFTPAIATAAGGAVTVTCTGLAGALGWKQTG